MQDTINQLRAQANYLQNKINAHIDASKKKKPEEEYTFTETERNESATTE